MTPNRIIKSEAMGLLKELIQMKKVEHFHVNKYNFSLSCIKNSKRN